MATPTLFAYGERLLCGQDADADAEDDARMPRLTSEYSWQIIRRLEDD